LTFVAGLLAALRTSMVPMPEIVSLPRNDNRTPAEVFAVALIRATSTALPVGAATVAVAGRALGNGVIARDCKR
jgi:anti-sigma factor RsiW